MLPLRTPYATAQPTAARSRARRTASSREDAPSCREDRRHVVPDGLLRQVQPLGDLGVAQPFVEQVEHLDLPVGEATDVRARAGARTTGDPGADRAAFVSVRSTSTSAPSRTNIARASRRSSSSSLSSRAHAAR